MSEETTPYGAAAPQEPTAQPTAQPATNTTKRISRTGFVLETYAGDSWCITGWPTQDYTFRSYASAYDVEDFLKERIGKHNGVEFDSESSQLFLIFSTREDASAYLDLIEEHLFRLKELV
jgi:hypothetical protein